MKSGKTLSLTAGAAAMLALSGCVTIESFSGDPPSLARQDGAIGASVLAATVLSPATGLPVLPEPQQAEPVVEKKKRPSAARKPHVTLASAQRADAPDPERRPPAAPLELVGLDEDQLRATLGAPSEQAESAPGKVWRYERNSCVVEVSLYPDVQSLIFRVLKYEVTSDDDTAKGNSACLPERRADASR